MFLQLGHQYLLQSQRSQTAQRCICSNHLRATTKPVVLHSNLSSGCLYTLTRLLQVEIWNGSHLKSTDRQCRSCQTSCSWANCKRALRCTAVRLGPVLGLFALKPSLTWTSSEVFCHLITVQQPGKLSVPDTLNHCQKSNLVEKTDVIWVLNQNMR